MPPATNSCPNAFALCLFCQEAWKMPSARCAYNPKVAPDLLQIFPAILYAFTSQTASPLAQHSKERQRLLSWHVESFKTSCVTKTQC